MILLSVGPGTGSLYAPRIAHSLVESGKKVDVRLEARAREFVGPAAFRDSDVTGVTLGDVSPAETPEALIFAPADSATLSRLAHGLGESPVFKEYASGTRPTVIVPDLGPEAKHPAVLENIALLGEDGCKILDGLGAGTVPGEVVSRTLHEIGGPFDGLRVVVTTGGTREPIDSVRFIGNRSSGKMGAAVARQAYRGGAEVSVVAANVPEIEPGVDWYTVENFTELRTKTLELCRDADALVMAAAVSDFTPASPLPDQKIRRGGRETMKLELSATSDILAELRESYPDLTIAGFAATHGDPRSDAREKLRKKGVNLVVGNDISQPGIGFGSEDNEAYIVVDGGDRDGYEEIFVSRGPKADLASTILDHLTQAIKRMEV